MKELIDNFKLRTRINTLESEIETLKNVIKNEAYEKIMKKLDEEPATKRLKEENIRLRLKNKEYKAEIAELRGDTNDKKRNTDKVICRNKEFIPGKPRTI